LYLEDRGHTVSVIDVNPDAFRRLGPRFSGDKVTGWGFDRMVLTNARISEAGAFAAVSSGDNSNIIAARVAREMFGLDNVVARIYDPRRAEVYQRLGIPTVATVKWTSDQMLRRLLPQGHVPELADPSGHVVIAEVAVNPAWVGRRVTALEEATGARAAYLTRLGAGILPSADTVYQEGDLVHLAALASDLPQVERVLDAPPPTTES
ncbi:MAG TPA: NAD-binding protein, partial [Pedococcus sp.]|nr:NAD-binding protein [Pedococcus sp.]